jgi:hypothetical protein
MQRFPYKVFGTLTLPHASATLHWSRDGAAVYLGIAKAYFGVWSPRDLPSLRAPFQSASARRLLRLRLSGLPRRGIADVPEAPVRSISIRRG